MEEAILATDMAVYSKNNVQLKELLTNGGYDIKKSNHRYTHSHLCIICKFFELNGMSHKCKV